MLKKDKQLLLLLALFFALGCSAVSSQATPVPAAPTDAKQNETSVSAIKDFDAVTLDAPGVLEITQGASEALEISGDPALVSAIRAEVKDRRLELVARSGIPANASITYKLVVKDVNDIVLNSFSAIKIPNLKTSRLTITINGGGRVQAGELTADTLRVEMSDGGSFSAGTIQSASAEFLSRGIGNISIENGSADKLDLELESGAFIGDNFECQSAAVTVNGPGTVLVWAFEKLDVKVNGPGRVTYYGEPVLSMSMSGGGQIVGGGRK